MGHKLDDTLLALPAMRMRMDYEAELSGNQAQWVAAYTTKDGEERSFFPLVAPKPDVFCSMFVYDMLKGLNKELHHDGAWICGMFLPETLQEHVETFQARYRKFIFMWVDKDGDIHVPVEIDEPLETILSAGPDVWASQCEAAWHTVQELNRTLDARSNDQYKRALGEKAPSLQ